MLKSCLLAALMGGALSVLAQILIDKTSLTPARILVIYVVSGVVLGAVGLYRPLFEVFGCGISVPLVGFGGAVAEGVREAVVTDGLPGVLSGALTAASGGIAAALVFGYLAALLAKGTTKKA